MHEMHGPTHPAITLTETDWRWATWRRLPPLTLPAAPPFDEAACLTRLAKKVRLTPRGFSWDLSRAALSPGMSSDEARLWLAALGAFERNAKPALVAASLAKGKLPAPTKKLARAALARFGSSDPPRELALVIARALSPELVTELVLAGAAPTLGYEVGGTFFHGYREHVFPYLDEAARDALRAELAPRLTAQGFPTDVYVPAPGPYLVGALLGLHEPLEAVLDAIPPERFAGKTWSHDSYQVPQILAFGLGSAERVAHHVGRLRLVLRHPTYVRAWLAHTEASALDDVASAVVAEKNKNVAATLAEVLALVAAPEAVLPMLRVLSGSKAPQVAVAWLEAHAALAAPRLAELAGGRGGLAEAARERLVILRRARPEVVEPALAGRG
jgi:hypothetical protein